MADSVSIFRSMQLVGGKIVPGDPDESLLIKRLITKQDSKRMPPLKSDNPQLNAEQIDLLKRWIKEGATFGTQSTQQ